MKKLTLLVLSLISGYLINARQVKAVSSGPWVTPTTWNTNAVPASGDTVTIPSATIVTITSNINTSTSTYVIKVYGFLSFVGGGSKLQMSPASEVMIYSGGMITGFSPSQTLQIGSSTPFSGSLGILFGPMIANNTTGNSFISASTLPVTFISFSALTQSGSVDLAWSTSVELKASHYEVERSADGTNWSTISYVMAAGTTTAQSNYSYKDKSVNGTVAYYRIKEVDIDGQTAYTMVKRVEWQNAVSSAAAALAITSIGSGNIVLESNTATAQTISVRLVSLSGQVVSQQVVEVNGKATIHTPFTGLYVVSAVTAQGQQAARQVIL
jgi:G8 domain